MMKTKTARPRAVALAALLAFAWIGAAFAAQLSGAIFTTTVDGTIVNANVQYETKPDVYLDGGPGPHAPSTAAGLPAGDYYFQVTDPSGKYLLSTDHISCREIRVNAGGVIDFVYPGSNWVKQQGSWVRVDCRHNFGTDTDHAAEGATTVQLFPYDDTPNAGGVYKAWITPVGKYMEPYPGYSVDPACSGAKCNVNGQSYQPGSFHGFIPSDSKTDNFKVKQKGKPFESPEISVRKFHDRNFNGVQDAGEEDITGWAVGVIDPLGGASTVYTPAVVVAEPSGSWTLSEATPAGTRQTASSLDGAPVSSYPNANPTVVVPVAGNSGEKHAVVYGNVGLGSIKACKIYDRNRSGQADAGEPGVPGWRMQLAGTDARGAAVGPSVQTTGSDGCTTFGSLLPGAYTVTELVPTQGGWSTVGATSASITIQSSLTGSVLAGNAETATFANFCLGSAAFGTKGYWHNVNGITELLGAGLADVAYANTLAPYAAPSSYFDTGDEPFDGHYTDGSCVAASDGAIGSIAPACSTQAEVSNFLVDPNAGGDPREQLAQQLLAFLFNSRRRLDDPGATIQLPDGSWASASGLVDQAVAVWVSGSAADQNAMQQLLNALNNNESGAGVTYVHYNACAVAY